MRIKKAISFFLEGYFATCKRSKKTVKAYSCDLLQFQRHLESNCDLRNIRPEMIESWAAQLRSDGYTPSSVQRKLASLKVFFNYWVRRDALRLSPCWQLKLSLGKSRQLPRTLSSQEIAGLLNRASQEVDNTNRGAAGQPTFRSFLALRNQAMVELMFATGVRVGEVAALKITDYIPDEHAFRIQGKGDRQRLAFLVDQQSCRVVTEYLLARNKLEVDNTALFVNLCRNPISAQGIANAISRLGQSAQIERHITPHMLRHTIATMLLQQGADLRVVQEFLGHASIATTQRYTHVSKAHLVASLQKHHPRSFI